MGWLADLLKDIPLSAMLREKLMEAEKKMASLEGKIASLEGENAELQNRLRQQQEKTQHLEKLLKGRSDVLDDNQQKILGLLADGREFLQEQIASELGLNVQSVRFHYRELCESDLIARRAAVGMPSRWVISHEGLRYLIEHGLPTT